MYITKTDYITNKTDDYKIVVEQPKARAQWLSEVLSGRKGGPMADKKKHKSRARDKHDSRRDFQ